MLSEESKDESTAGEHPIVLYDGVCGLCHRSIRFLLRNDREGILRFAPLQGPTAERLRGQFRQIPETLQSVVLIEANTVYLRSKAFLVVSRHLRYPWKVASWFRWMPGWLLDPFYWLIARLRYRIFGRYDTCALPAPGEQERFLE